jgi:hypothetical protein
MMPIGVALTVGAMVLLLSGRAATRQYLDPHLARYGKLPPNLTWFFRADPDPRPRPTVGVRWPSGYRPSASSSSERCSSSSRRPS